MTNQRHTAAASYYKKTSQKGIDFIKKMESLELHAYKCAAGVWTIGYGHTGFEVVPGMEITPEDAEMFLRNDLSDFELFISGVMRRNSVDLNQDQFDALVSLAFNIGKKNFGNSTLLKKVIADANDLRAISREWIKWIHAKSTPLRGLMKRRAMELMIYFSVDELLTLTDQD